MKKAEPQHVGILLASKMGGLNQSALATMIGCHKTHINEVIAGKRGLSAYYAVRIEKVLKVSAKSLMSAQIDYELWQARKQL